MNRVSLIELANEHVITSIKKCWGGGGKIVVVADDRNAERALKTSLHK